MKKNKQKHTKKQQPTIIDSLDTRIAKAVYAEKKISERIIGYIPYEIEFVKATYNGRTQRPAKISAIEKGIVGILLLDGHSSFDTIGQILGLDVVNDKAEKSILTKAMVGLRSFEAVEGDDDYIALTETGRVYAEKGERPDTYQKLFDIFVDTEHRDWMTLKKALSNVTQYINFNNIKCDDLSLPLDEVKEYAAIQAQDVHYPQERYLLQSVDWREGCSGSYKIYICFVQGVSTGNVRAFAFDENTGALNPIVADYINSNETLASQLLEQCIKLECEQNIGTVILDDTEVEKAKAEIKPEMIEAEKRLVDEENGDVDVEAEDKGSIQDTYSNTIPSTQKPRKQTTKKISERLHKKALYDSVSFEVELQKIFKEDNPDEIWLMSPWIRKSAFLNDRGPLIESFLADENKRIFIAYSEPAQTKNDEKPMIDEEVEPGIQQLAAQYSNFFYVQLPEFHFKNVIEVKGDQKILFSGSFNVLSFSVSERKTHVRREEMALANPSTAKSKHVGFQVEFAQIYAERIKKEIEKLSLDEVNEYDNERMDYFLGLDNEVIKKLFIPLVELLDEKKYQSMVSSIRKRLTIIGQRLVALANTTGISIKQKNELRKNLNSIEMDVNSNNVDDPSLTELLANNKLLLENIKEQKIFTGRTDGNKYSKQRITNSNQEKVKVNNVLAENPESSLKGLSLYLARMSQAFINMEIKKTPMNAKLLSIVQDSQLYRLIDTLTVAQSKNKENAFDLSIGINGLLFRYPTLFNNKEDFVSKQKRTQKQLSQVNKSNIQSVVKQLS
ncbi:MAG: hypothetical protein IKQ94_03920 [Bacteroidales bacterium]|nr:hypothetical protein [Bacteroidales bacterium]